MRNQTITPTRTRTAPEAFTFVSRHGSKVLVNRKNERGRMALEVADTGSVDTARAFAVQRDLIVWADRSTETGELVAIRPFDQE